MSVWTICGAGPEQGDGVGDFAWMLALRVARTHPVTLLLPAGHEPPDPDPLGDDVDVLPVPAGWGPRAVAAALERIPSGACVIVHFVPHLYGWYGVNPALAWLLGRLRQRSCYVVTVAHELGVPAALRPGRLALALAHRALLRAVVAASGRVVLTTEFARRLMCRRYPSRAADFRRIPVSSTIPVVRLDEGRRAALRAELGIGEADLVAALFGSGLAGTAARVARVLAAFDELGTPVRLLVVGKQTDRFCRQLADLGRVRGIVALGPLSARAVSACLAIADLFLAFYPDGASTRRTSLMAALAHGLPVVTSAGPLTDEALREQSGLCFIDEETAGGLEALREIGTCPDARRGRGAAGRAWYSQHCDWDRVSAAYLRVLDEVAW